MKKIKLNSFIFLFLTLVIFSSCGQKEENPPLSSSDAPLQELSSSQEPASQDLIPASLTFTLKPFDKSSESAKILLDDELPDEEYITDIYVTTDKKLTGLNLSALSLSEDASYKKERIIASLPSLSPEETLILRTSFPGDLPNRCFTFKDADGTEKNYALSLSGKDGSLICESF